MHHSPLITREPTVSCLSSICPLSSSARNCAPCHPSLHSKLLSQLLTIPLVTVNLSGQSRPLPLHLHIPISYSSNQHLLLDTPFSLPYYSSTSITLTWTSPLHTNILPAFHLSQVLNRTSNLGMYICFFLCITVTSTLLQRSDLLRTKFVEGSSDSCLLRVSCLLRSLLPSRRAILSWCISHSQLHSK